MKKKDKRGYEMKFCWEKILKKQRLARYQRIGKVTRLGDKDLKKQR